MKAREVVDLDHAEQQHERAAVGCALHGTEPAQVVLGLLRPEHLTDPRLTDILTAVRALLDRDITPDVLLVFAELRRNLGAQRQSELQTLLHSLWAEVPTPASARHYAAEVLAARWRRVAARMGARLQQAASSPHAIPDDDLLALLAEQHTAVMAAHDEYRRATTAPVTAGP